VEYPNRIGQWRSGHRQEPRSGSAEPTWLFDVETRLRELSAKGDALERLSELLDFEMFRSDLERAVPRSDGSKGGRPAFDHVLMFKVLLLQAMHTLSDERCEYLIKDRLSFMRFLGLGLGDVVPDANTIWNFRETLKRSGAIEQLFARFDVRLKEAGYLAMGGQIVDASIVLHRSSTTPKLRRLRSRRDASRRSGRSVQRNCARRIAMPAGP
jgi:transposase, IS5 family